jgi:hypothetical protein
MNVQTPCSDYVETYGVVFFARMLDKIRLQAAGVLPEGYNLGDSPDPVCFDARFCRFWEIDYQEAKVRTLEGATNEEVFDFCFRHRRRPNEEQVLVWNSFLIKRGWRDSPPEIEGDKRDLGLAHRDDIQTYVDLHDVDEGRTPRFSR